MEGPWCSYELKRPLISEDSLQFWEGTDLSNRVVAKHNLSWLFCGRASPLTHEWSPTFWCCHRQSSFYDESILPIFSSKRVCLSSRRSCLLVNASTQAIHRPSCDSFPEIKWSLALQIYLKALLYLSCSLCNKTRGFVLCFEVWCLTSERGVILLSWCLNVPLGLY